MAASSTSTPINAQLPASGMQLYTNYSMVSVTTGGHFWPETSTSDSTTTCSPPPVNEANWEVDEEEAIKRRIYELKRQFHNGRYLLVRHLPRDATEQASTHVLCPSVCSTAVRGVAPAVRV